jgi:hypothetical protein
LVEPDIVGPTGSHRKGTARRCERMESFWIPSKVRVLPRGAVVVAVRYRLGYKDEAVRRF